MNPVVSRRFTRDWTDNTTNDQTIIGGTQVGSGGQLQITPSSGVASAYSMFGKLPSTTPTKIISCDVPYPNLGTQAVGLYFNCSFSGAEIFNGYRIDLLGPLALIRGLQWTGGVPLGLGNVPVNGAVPAGTVRRFGAMYEPGLITLVYGFNTIDAQVITLAPTIPYNSGLAGIFAFSNPSGSTMAFDNLTVRY